MALCGTLAQLKKQLSFLSSKAWAQALLILAQGWVYWLAWGAIYELTHHLKVKPYGLKCLSCAGKNTLALWKGKLCCSYETPCQPRAGPFHLELNPPPRHQVHLPTTKPFLPCKLDHSDLHYPCEQDLVSGRVWSDGDRLTADIDLNPGTQKLLSELVEE